MPPGARFVPSKRRRIPRSRTAISSKGSCSRAGRRPASPARGATLAFGEIGRLAHMQVTGGSASVRFTGQMGLRAAGAAAREMLVAAAAAQLGVPASELVDAGWHGDARGQQAIDPLRRTRAARGRAGHAFARHAEEAKRVPLDRHGAAADGHSREGHRPHEIRHRREPARHAGRDRDGRARAWRAARASRRSAGTRRARRPKGRQACQRRRRCRRWLLGGAHRPGRLEAGILVGAERATHERDDRHALQRGTRERRGEEGPLARRSRQGHRGPALPPPTPSRSCTTRRWSRSTSRRCGMQAS